MNKRHMGMTREQRLDYLEIREVKEFYDRLRGRIAAGQMRAVLAGQLTIPETVLDLIRDNIENFSKLAKYVRVRLLRGDGRQLVTGEIPEAVWTEAKGTLNELEIDLGHFEVEGYLVGGYFPIAKSMLDDSAIALADEIEYMFGRAIGYALDKAILYGTGDRMPLGIITRLANATPDDGPDLSESNIKTIDGSTKTGVQLFKEMLMAFSNAKSNRALAGAVLAMSEDTWNKLILPEAIGIGTMIDVNNPALIGKKVEFLDFIPEGDIAGGYLDRYVLYERDGGIFGSSSHVRFAEDEITFKGAARYDGKILFADSFILMNIKNENPATTVPFAEDLENQ